MEFLVNLLAITSFLWNLPFLPINSHRSPNNKSCFLSNGYPTRTGL